jgi:hypothetical protein
VILTSNRTAELHDALKRRCLFHWITHPGLEREVEIVRLRVPGVPERLAARPPRSSPACAPRPGPRPRGWAETIDWAHALAACGCEELDAAVVEQTLGSVLKYHEDFELVRDDTVAELCARRAAAPRRPWRRERRAPRKASSGASCGGGLEDRAGAWPTRCTASTASTSPAGGRLYWTLRTTLVARRGGARAVRPRVPCVVPRRARRRRRPPGDPRNAPPGAQRTRRDARRGADARRPTASPTPSGRVRTRSCAARTSRR